MQDETGPSRARVTAALVIAAMTLALVALLGAATVYLAMRVAILDKQGERLQMAQAELKSAIEALQASAPAQPAGPPPAASAPATPAAPEGSPPSAPAAESAPPSPPAAAGPGPEAPAPSAEAAPQAETYSVRVFASPVVANKTKLERFVGVVRSMGFNVDVSENNIAESTGSTILYHPSAAGVANKLASSLKAKYPSLNFELKTSPAINDNLKRVLIVSLNQNVLN